MAVVWALYRVGRELLFAGAAILAAFADLLGVLVRTLPHVMLAGVIALGGVWLINHLDNSLVRMPAWLQASDQTGSPETRQNNPPSGQQAIRPKIRSEPVSFSLRSSHVASEPGTHGPHLWMWSNVLMSLSFRTD
jgi:hypothetical protein